MMDNNKPIKHACLSSKLSYFFIVHFYYIIAYPATMHIKSSSLFAFSGSSTKLIKFSYSMFIFSDKMHIIIISITILFHAISIIAHFVSNSTKYR